MSKKEIKLLNEDNRGKIEQLCDNVLMINSYRGVIRANHWHRCFGHWSLVMHGSITYFERSINSLDKPIMNKFVEGDLFWTPPLYSHCMKFEEFDKNEFYCFSDGSREQKNYENDTIKLDYDLSEVYNNWKD